MLEMGRERRASLFLLSSSQATVLGDAGHGAHCTWCARGKREWWQKETEWSRGARVEQSVNDPTLDHLFAKESARQGERSCSSLPKGTRTLLGSDPCVRRKKCGNSNLTLELQSFTEDVAYKALGVHFKDVDALVTVIIRAIEGDACVRGHGRANVPDNAGHQGGRLLALKFENKNEIDGQYWINHLFAVRACVAASYHGRGADDGRPGRTRGCLSSTAACPVRQWPHARIRVRFGRHRLHAPLV